MSDLKYFSDPTFYDFTQQVIAVASTGTSFRHNNGPQIYPHPDSQNLWEGFCRRDFLKDLEIGEIIMDHPDGPNAITRVLTGKRQRGRVWEGNVKWILEWCDCWLWRWKRARSLGTWAVPKNRKRQGNGVSPRASRRNVALLTHLGFLPPEWQEKKSVLL